MFAKCLIIRLWHSDAKKRGTVECVEEVWKTSPKSWGTLLGNGEWHRMSGHDRKAIIQQGRTMNPIGFTVRPCYVL